MRTMFIKWLFKQTSLTIIYINKNYIIMNNTNICGICNSSESSVGFHYGVVTCEACKVYHRFHLIINIFK